MATTELAPEQVEHAAQGATPEAFHVLPATHAAGATLFATHAPLLSE